jgi:hypothetical protein
LSLPFSADWNPKEGVHGPLYIVSPKLEREKLLDQPINYLYTEQLIALAILHTLCQRSNFFLMLVSVLLQLFQSFI